MFGNSRIRKAEFVVLFFLALAGVCASAQAQFRVFAKLYANPAETTTPLIFDVNNDGADNINPNIVIAQDQKRGFVSYTGSGTVVEFSLTTGEVLNRIKTGGNPCFATQLPDNHTLAIVSVLDNKVFLIDTNSPSRQIATYTFNRAQFGFGSILTLSPDGTFGYLSSTGTGEVIKFRMIDGTEIGRFTGPASDPKARLRFPTQITITPDGATMIVVDTDPGTPEVAFFDTTSFTKKASLKNPNPTTQIVAFSIFNKAVLAPDGKTGIIASRGQNNVLYTELVFLFDANTGAILKTGAAGAGPGWTGITPDGKKWVIINMFSLTVIPTDNFDGNIEYQAPSGESLGSANMAFSPDSRFGYYCATGQTSILRDEVLQVDLETGSYLEKLQIGDSPDTLNDQPSGIAITNDGKTIVAMEFVSDNIDLMGPITLVAGGKFLCSPDYFTGLSLLNLSAKEATVTLYAMQDFGEPNQETGVHNPVNYVLSPNQQLSFTVSEIFNFDDLNAPNGSRTGWVAIYSDQPEITGYVTIGKKDFTSLNGLPLDSNDRRMFDWILPTVNRNGDAAVEFSTLNDTFYSVSYELTRVGKDGIIIDSSTGNSAGGNYRVELQMPDLFPRDHLDIEGYMWMTSAEGLFSSEVYNNGVSTEIIKGIDREKFVGVKKVYAPQFATVEGWKTTLNLINANENDATVTVTFHAQNGDILWQFQRPFIKGEQLRANIKDLYLDTPGEITTLVDNPAFASSVGWLEVESTQERIIGLVTFNADDDHFSASYELSATPLSNFLFPIVSQNENYETGVALLNGESESAHVSLELYDMEGSKVGSALLTLAPQSQTAIYLDSLFPNVNSLLMGNLRIRSDKSIYGFGIVNDSGFNFMMAMPAIKMF